MLLLQPLVLMRSCSCTFPRVRDMMLTCYCPPLQGVNTWERMKQGFETL